MKDALRKKIFGMPIALLMIGVLVVGGASAVLLNVYLSIDESSAEVEQSVQWINGGTGAKTFSFDGETHNGGDTVIEKVGLENFGGALAKDTIETKCDTGGQINTEDGNSYEESSNRDISWSNANICEGIRTRYVEYFDEAGADLSEYEGPEVEDCDVIVDGESGDDVEYANIQNAIGASSSGDMICVRNGDYNEDVNVNKGVALTTLNGPDGVTLDGGFDVSADGASIEGFEVTGGMVNSGRHRTGILVTASEVSIANNRVKDIEQAPSKTAHGIQVWAQDPAITDVKVTNNLVDGVDNGDQWGAYGIMLQGDIGVEASHNTVKNIRGVWIAGISTSPTDDYTPTKVVVTDNIIKENEGTVYEPVAFYLDGDKSNDRDASNDVDARVVTLKRNNFEGTHWDVGNRDEFHTLDATDNWFGTNGMQILGSDQLYDGDVDADWMYDDLEIDPNTEDTFGVITDFAVNIAPETYTLSADIVPDTSS